MAKNGNGLDALSALPDGLKSKFSDEEKDQLVKGLIQSILSQSLFSNIGRDPRALVSDNPIAVNQGQSSAQFGAFSGFPPQGTVFGGGLPHPVQKGPQLTSAIGGLATNVLGGINTFRDRNKKKDPMEEAFKMILELAESSGG